MLASTAGCSVVSVLPCKGSQTHRPSNTLTLQASMSPKCSCMAPLCAMPLTLLAAAALAVLSLKGCDQDQQSMLVANGETSICRSYMESPFWGSEEECGVQGGFRVHCFFGLCCGRGFKACDSGQCCHIENCGRSPQWEDFEDHCDNFDFTAANPNGYEKSDDGFWLLNVSGASRRLDGAPVTNSTESEASWGSNRFLARKIVLKGYSGVWEASDSSVYDFNMLSDGVYCTMPCTLNITVSSQQMPMVVSLYHNEEESYCGSCAAVSVDGQPARLIRSSAARELASSTITRWASEVPGPSYFEGQITITIASPENVLECPVCPQGCSCTNQRVSLAGFSVEGLVCSLFTTEDCPLQHCIVKNGICDRN